MNYDILANFYKGKKIFVTGHTGFKGAWLCKILVLLGADVYGYALYPSSEPSLFKLLNIDKHINSTIGDIRDFQKLRESVLNANPDYVFHLAAQPLVLDSYLMPRETYEINVMGTVNILECIRSSSTIKSFINITTDKVYENLDSQNHAFKEDEKLDGYDPYSNSKSCSEILTHSYKKSFFSGAESPKISTARAGNVIGGGDFANNRIIPDCVRATLEGKFINIRNPYFIRPYQHVLEPLTVYLILVMKQIENSNLEGSYNIGPDVEDCITSSEIADKFVQSWGENAKWQYLSDQKNPHEASFLKLDCTKLKESLEWKPTWQIDVSIEETVDWYKAWSLNQDIIKFTENQIMRFLSDLDGKFSL